MGESKQRKISDSGYGVRPKGGRGIMLVPDFHEDGTSSVLQTASQLNAEQVRFGLCFWERIAWPSIYSLSSANDADMDFLSSAGVLLRPEAVLVPNLKSPGKGLAETYFRAYQDLDAKEPGRWSLSTTAEWDIKFFLGEHIAPDRGITVSLHRAIPIPTRSVMLHDLLEFREKREAELLALRAELDNCKRLITSSTDRAETFATQRDRIDAACRDLLLVSRERKMPVRISDLSMSFEFNGPAAVSATAAAAAFATNPNFNGLQALLISMGLALPSFIKVTGTFGLKNKTNLQRSPFRYVSYLHEELDWL
ncbi:DUF6236 family protein [Thauera sinica]|uniref:DUF6236 family protein n=1 Tax=Thauera sinica TaxID=2665146 RepID=A0ABW1ANE6_9RHOO|nr:DUF6236 family protein [Thauera sp. K11]